MKKITRTYLNVEIGQHVYLVYSSKRAGAEKNIVFESVVGQALVNEQGITYTCTPLKVVTDKKENPKKWGNFFSFKNANIDTGHADYKYRFPVFTTKERCLKWLRG